MKCYHILYLIKVIYIQNANLDFKRIFCYKRKLNDVTNSAIIHILNDIKKSKLNMTVDIFVPQLEKNLIKLKNTLSI